MKKHLLFMLLCILLLGSCRPAVKTAILPLSGSHIESAAETALSQKSSLVGGSIEGGMGQDPYQSMDCLLYTSRCV